MQNRRTLMFTPTVLFALIAAVLGLIAYGQQRAVSKLKAATETAQTTAIRETADTMPVSKPDVTVNGQHVDVPSNGTTSQDVSGGGHVSVTTNGSSTVSSSSPDGSVHVSITSTSGGNASTNSSTRIQSNSSFQSSDWSQVNVFANGTNSVDVHN